MNTRIYYLCSVLALTGALAACGDDRTDTSGIGTDTDSTAQNTTPGDTTAMPGDTTAMPPADTTPGDTTMGSPDTTGSAGAPGASMDDAALAARVKSALEADTQLAGNNISVEIVDGRVVLTGEVNDTNQVQRATEIATNVEGVSTVDNRLTASSS